MPGTSFELTLDGAVQEGGITLGGSLYGRVYSTPVPRGGSSWDGNLWEQSSASADQSFTGKRQPAL